MNAGEHNPLGNRRSLSLNQMLWYSVANLGYGMFFSLNNALIAPFLGDYTKNAVVLGLMGSTHSVEGALIQPLVGSWSDRLRTRLGRRRPFILFFTPISALLLAFTPAATHLSGSIRLMTLVALIFLFTVLFNIAFDPYQALMPDITPESQRGRVTAVWSFVGLIGQASILLFPFSISLKFVLVAVMMVCSALVTCYFTPEPIGNLSEHTLSYGKQLTLALRGIRTLKQARNGLIVFFLSGVGIGAVLPFLTEFVLHITHCTKYQAGLMFLALMASTAIGVLPAGRLTDKFGPKQALFVGFALVIFASLNGLWITTLTQFTLTMVIAGLGNAAMSAASYPLLTDLVPGEEVGFYTGLQSTAQSIAQPLTVTVTGILINQGHGAYRWIFVVCVISLVLAMALLAAVRPELASEEIERHLNIQREGMTAG